MLYINKQTNKKKKSIQILQNIYRSRTPKTYNSEILTGLSGIHPNTPPTQNLKILKQPHNIPSQISKKKR